MALSAAGKSQNPELPLGKAEYLASHSSAWCFIDTARLSAVLVWNTVKERAVPFLPHTCTHIHEYYPHQCYTHCLSTQQNRFPGLEKQMACGTAPAIEQR